jgi:hypothetical protein
MSRKIKDFIKDHQLLSAAAISGVFFFFLGLAGEDVYKLKIKPIIFSTKPEISFKSVSTSTLEPSYFIHGKGHYYEITCFRIENIGDYETKKKHKLKIQARGEILGITPKGLESRFQIDKTEKTVGIFDLENLGPRETIKGEIHSLSKMSIDREEVQIGIDPIGDFKLIGPKLL